MQLRRQKFRERETSGDVIASSSSSSSVLSCEFHDLSSSPLLSSASETEVNVDPQPVPGIIDHHEQVVPGITDSIDDIFLRPSTYRLPASVDTAADSTADAEETPTSYSSMNGHLH